MIDAFLRDATPVIGYLEITTHCNHECVHCYMESKNTPDELTRSEIGNVLDSMAKLGTLILVITGGEPLLRPDTLDIIDDARSRGFAVVLFTNGTRIDRPMARRIHLQALMGVEISLHGASAEIHDTVTGVMGSFDKAVTAIRYLTDAGVRVKIKCNLITHTMQHYEDVISLAQHLNVAYRFDPYIYPKRDGDETPLQYRVSDKEFAKILSDPRLVPSPQCAETESYLEIGTNRVCGAGTNIVCVGSTGEVFPCIPLRENAGSVRENSLDVIWKTSPVFDRLRELRNSDLECATCELVRYCSRCMAMAQNETGNLRGCSPLSRRMAQVRRDLSNEDSRTREASYA